MANFVDSIGYRLEKLHSGMIVYLCDLWNEGTRNPLRLFLSNLGIEISSERIEAKREYKNIDLVIFDSQQHPLIAIEMKVDNHESKISRKEIPGVRDYQTRMYPQLIPSCEHFMLVTLGLGEYYRAPHDDRFDWVRIERFLRSLEAIPEGDPFVDAWRETIRKEKNFQERCRRKDRNGIKKEQARIWNTYFLGFLKEHLERSLSDSLEVDLTVYPYSSDTILNFGLSREPYYMEINSNGKLNLKVNLKALDETADKRRVLEKAKEYYVQRLGPEDSELKSTGGSLKKSKTLISFEIGLEKSDGFFAFLDESKTYERITEIVERFYGNLPGPSLPPRSG